MNERPSPGVVYDQALLSRFVARAIITESEGMVNRIMTLTFGVLVELSNIEGMPEIHEMIDDFRLAAKMISKANQQKEEGANETKQ